MGSAPAPAGSIAAGGPPAAGAGAVHALTTSPESASASQPGSPTASSTPPHNSLASAATSFHHHPRGRLVSRACDRCRRRKAKVSLAPLLLLHLVIDCSSCSSCPSSSSSSSSSSTPLRLLGPGPCSSYVLTARASSLRSRSPSSRPLLLHVCYACLQTYTQYISIHDKRCVVLCRVYCCIHVVFITRVVHTAVSLQTPDLVRL
ncbi:hypothetical protein V8C44DRAFT_327819 [Trichoderma aethiopicum]